ncbi:MAG: ABC transporter substrate-binding protein [Acidimicrobiia bacterium]|nr:ABC transporter substrate-binding protein [Acidimicrobiia bacterium]
MTTTTLLRRWRALAVVTTLALAAGSCGGDSDEGATDDAIDTGVVGDQEVADLEPQHGGKLIVGIEAEGNEWTPGPGQFSGGGSSIAYAIYDPLIQLNEDGDFAPFLAESLEPNEDLTEWTLKLRPGVTFHDGSPLDAETLKWNFDTLHTDETSPSAGTVRSFGVTSVDVVDELTVVYRLSEPHAGLPDMLRGEIGWPISRVAYEADPEGFGSAPVGTGPFVFQEWRRDDRFVATRNEDYWFTTPEGDQLPYLDEIEFRPIPDDDSRSAALASDDIQVLQTLRGTSVKRVMDMVDEGGFRASLFVGNTSSATLINTEIPPLDDVRIRQAMAFAGDGEAMAAVRDDDGLVPLTTQFFGPNSPWFSEVVAEAYPGAAGRDVDQATALVEEYKNDPERSDGLPGGDPITIDYQCQPDPSLLEGAQLLQGLYSEVGIELELQQVDQSTMISNVVGTGDTEPPFVGNFQLACWRAGGGDGDPLSTLLNFFGPVPTSSGNFTNFTSPEIDDALERLRGTTDFEERYQAVEDLGLVVAEQVPLTWNQATPTLIGYREDVIGIPTWGFPDGTPGNGTPGASMHFHQVFLTD